MFNITNNLFRYVDNVQYISFCSLVLPRVYTALISYTHTNEMFVIFMVSLLVTHPTKALQ